MNLVSVEVVTILIYANEIFIYYDMGIDGVIVFCLSMSISLILFYFE